MSRQYRQRPQQDDGPRVNEKITSSEIRVVGDDGEIHGVMSVEKALDIAYEAGLDLVEVAPNSKPPVCKVMDYGKYKFEQKKKAAAARKKQKTIDIKEVKIRPGIEEHDFQVKLRNAERFLNNGDKVKVTMRFRGREMAHQNIGVEILERMKTELEEISKIELAPKFEGRQIIMILASTVGKS